MSLIHWWPLTGDLKDKIGNNHLKYSNDIGAIGANSEGKVGSCYERTTVNAGQSLVSQYKVDNVKSMACWAYVSNATETTANGLITHHNHNVFSGLGITVKRMSDTDYRMSVNTGDGSSRTYYHYYGTTNIKDAWHHLCVTFNEKTKMISLYVDGKLECTVKNYEQFIQNEYIGVFCWSLGQINTARYRPVCKINDVRIYDHTLSQAEIQELKKALVLHYTFDDILAEPTTNYGNQGNWFSYDAYWTVKTENNIQKLTKSTNAEPTVALGNSTLLSQMSVGEIWTMSCYLYKEGQPFKTTCTGGQGSSSYGLIYELISSRSQDDGYFESTFKITEKTGSYIFHARLFGDSISANTQCEIRQLQFEKKDHATPYTPTTRAGMLYNETGLIQPDNNTIQNMQLTTNAAINTQSLKCNNTKILTPITGDVSQGATLSLWINLPKDNSGNNIFPSSSEVVVTDNNSQLAFGFYNSMHGIITCNGFKKPIMTNLKTALVNDWNHIVVIRDSNNNIKSYLNGVEYSLTGSQEWTHSESYCSIGCRYSGSWTSYYSGQVDDIRLYNTCLSPEEIKDLYNCGGRISNLGDALTGEFIEGENATKVNKNHTIITKEIYEQILPDEYQQLEYIYNEGGTAYISTNFIPNNNTSIVLTYQYDGGFGALFGSRKATASSVFAMWLEHNTTSTNTIYPHYGNRTYNTHPVVVSDISKKLIYTLQKNTCKIYSADNHILLGASTSDQVTFDSQYPLTILGINSGGGNGDSRRAQGKLYSCQIYDNNILTLNLYPARRISDSTLGLYDIINNQFYTNTGTGSFTAGPTITTGQASMLREGGLTAREIIEI